MSMFALLLEQTLGTMQGDPSAAVDKAVLLRRFTTSQIIAVHNIPDYVCYGRADVYVCTLVKYLHVQALNYMHVL